MSKYEASIEYGEIPVTKTADELLVAASTLAVKNSAIIIPKEIETSNGPIVGQGFKMAVLLAGLNKDLVGSWMNSNAWFRESTPSSDVGFHGNPYNPVLGTDDHLRWHAQADGSLELTVAQAQPGYVQNREYANRALTDLLRQDRTDTRFADPATFKRATLGPEDTVVFRFSEGGPDGNPLLHDFRTTSEHRTSLLADIIRYEVMPVVVIVREYPTIY